MDVSKPVENPDLVAQLLRFHASGGRDEDARETLQLVRDANYLLATQVSHPDGGPPIADGVMRAGTIINIYTVQLPDGRSALAAFTDWPSMRAAVGEGADWQGLIQPGVEVFAMGTSIGYPGGVVINPFGPEVTLEMTPERIAWMRANTNG